MMFVHINTKGRELGMPTYDNHKTYSNKIPCAREDCQCANNAREQNGCKDLKSLEHTGKEVQKNKCQGCCDELSDSSAAIEVSKEKYAAQDMFDAPDPYAHSRSPS